MSTLLLPSPIYGRGAGGEGMSTALPISLSPTLSHEWERGLAVHAFWALRR